MTIFKVLAKHANSITWIIVVVLSVIALGLIVRFPDKISSVGSGNASAAVDVNSKPTFDQRFFECVCDLPNVTSGADCGYFQYLETEDPGRLGLTTFVASGQCVITSCADT
jgi:hypothetical protein